jgi:hypothetical protein
MCLLSPPTSAGLLLFLALVVSGQGALCAEPGSHPQFNVKEFGAAGDGKALETPDLTRAIRACAQAGGGTVEFPTGEYVTGTLQLLSHVTLNLEPGAILIGQLLSPAGSSQVIAALLPQNHE